MNNEYYFYHITYIGKDYLRLVEDYQVNTPPTKADAQW
jgi:hypothetical protein